MSGATGAIIGGSILTAGAGIYGANRASSAASSAARTSANAQLTIDERNRADLAPYRQAGYGALDQLTQLYGIAPRSAGGAAAGGPPPGGTQFEGRGRFSILNGLNGGTPAPPAGPASTAPPTTRDLSAFYTSPQYEFVRGEGLRGISNSRSVTGSGSGGNAIRGASAFASNLASGEFQSYVDRLFGIAGLGSGATQVGVQSGSNTAANLANIYTNAGNVRASAYLSGASSVNNAVQGGLQNHALISYLNAGSGTQGLPTGVIPNQSTNNAGSAFSSRGPY